MRITSIETLVCPARMRNWIFVKVITDQPGSWGWGEAALEWNTRSVVGAIEDVEEKGRIVRPNEKPGLGIEINEEEVKKHPFQQEKLQRTFYKDGSVGDW